MFEYLCIYIYYKYDLNRVFKFLVFEEQGVIANQSRDQKGNMFIFLYKSRKNIHSIINQSTKKPSNKSETV